jgi:hypothetical protein
MNAEGLPFFEEIFQKQPFFRFSIPLTPFVACDLHFCFLENSVFTVMQGAALL